jgi:hypothetical protein
MSAQIIKLTESGWKEEIKNNSDLSARTKSVLTRAVQTWLEKPYRYLIAAYPQIDPEDFDNILIHEILSVEIGDKRLVPEISLDGNHRHFCLIKAD